MRRFLAVYAALFLSCLAYCYAGQVAPPNFRALPGVGPFSADQIGRWDATGRKFRGASYLKASDTGVDQPILFTGTPHTNAWVSIAPAPGSFTSSFNTALYVSMTEPAAATQSGRAALLEQISTGTGIATAVTVNSYFDGTVTCPAQSGLNSFAVTTNSGTITTQNGLLGLAGVQAGAATIAQANAIHAQISNHGGAATITDARCFWAQAFLNAGTTSAVSGLNISGWDAAGGTVPVSDGIYADTSIDVGASRHFIRSLSTSPSILAGDVAITNSAKGFVLKDSVTAHYVRLTLANGVLTQTDLGTTTP